MAETVHNILHTTIKTIYPKYYPKEVVDFFCAHHSMEHVAEGIASGKMGVLTDGKTIVGTGCYFDNHITGVYVLPEYQGYGYGTIIMNHLEAKISEKYDTVLLDASLAAVFLYEHRGYKTIGHGKYELENGVKLVYEIMEKKLADNRTKIDYDGKIFVPIVNSENGEVDDNTTFRYHQSGTDFQADYTGGDIKIGTMVGKVSENGELDFYYQHLNVNGEMRVGKCHSVPQINSNGKIELHEQWQWLNGDCSSGSSIVVEKDDFSTDKK